MQCCATSRRFLYRQFKCAQPVRGVRKTPDGLACSRLSVSVDDRKSGRATSGVCEKEVATPSPFHSWIPLAADPACHPLAFSIVLADREPGTMSRIRDRHGFTLAFFPIQTRAKLKPHNHVFSLAYFLSLSAR